MGYLEDLQKCVYLLSSPLGSEIMGRRNRVAKIMKRIFDAGGRPLSPRASFTDRPGGQEVGQTPECRSPPPGKARVC